MEYSEVSEVQVYEGSYISLPMYLGPEVDHRKSLHSFKSLCLARSIKLELCTRLSESGFKGRGTPHNCFMEQLVKQVHRQRHGIP